jgi:hypothetical protein
MEEPCSCCSGHATVSRLGSAACVAASAPRRR